MTEEKSYPLDFDDDELIVKVRSYNVELKNTNFSANASLILGPLIASGQNELLRRRIMQLEDSTDKVERAVRTLHLSSKDNAESSKKLTTLTRQLKTITSRNAEESSINSKTAKTLAFASIGIAIISAIMAGYFAWSANKTSNSWQEKQLRVLNEQLEELKKK